jgi:hypothetical protein
LTSWQVCKLHFLNQPNSDGQPRSQVAARAAANRYCLRRLKDLGLVKVKPIPRVDNPMHKWEMNYLTPTGHEVLTAHRQALNLSTSPYRSPAKLTFEVINPHTMGIIDAGISAMVGAAKYGMQVEVWLQDMDIRSLLKSDQLYWPMEPDAFLVLRYGEARRAFFVEVDRGTMSGQSPRPNSWSTKMEKYRTYFQSLRSTDPWLKDLPQPDVMVVTTTEARLANLMKATGNAGGRSAYWFTTADLLEPPYSFFGRVWQRIGLDGYYTPTERFAS